MSDALAMYRAPYTPAEGAGRVALYVEQAEIEMLTPVDAFTDLLADTFHAMEARGLDLNAVLAAALKVYADERDVYAS